MQTCDRHPALDLIHLRTPHHEPRAVRRQVADLDAVIAVRGGAIGTDVEALLTHRAGEIGGSRIVLADHHVAATPTDRRGEVEEAGGHRLGRPPVVEMVGLDVGHDADAGVEA